MDIKIKKITDENRERVLNLQIKESQNTYIESVEDCLKESVEYTNFKPVGLYKNDCLVGFAMYGLFCDEGENGRVWLDRFLIDKKHQGKGLGSSMIEYLIDHIAKEYKCNEIFLSLYEDNKGALNLYKKFGFEFNGELDVNGEKVMVKKL